MEKEYLCRGRNNRVKCWKLDYGKHINMQEQAQEHRVETTRLSISLLEEIILEYPYAESYYRPTIEYLEKNLADYTYVIAVMEKDYDDFEPCTDCPARGTI
jgi:hypothetical protein